MKHARIQRLRTAVSVRLRQVMRSMPCARSLLVGFVLVCASAQLAAQVPKQIRPGLDSLTAEGLLQHMRILASDEFEGRAPGTPGEDKTVQYLVDQLQKIGLKPGNPDGTYIQNVPLVGTVAHAAVSCSVGNETKPVALPADCVVWTRRVVPEVKVDKAEMVFVGYGVVAPEYGWDDYKGVDVRGKTLVMLINDPQVPYAKDPEKLDPEKFKGKAMTYYGRWTYKFEIAAEKGAAAALIIHETDMAGYPWEVVQASNTRENFVLEAPDNNEGRAAVEGWVQLQAARRLLAACGFDLDALKKAALTKEFKPVPLGGRASFTITNTIRKVASRNVIARLEGADSKLRGEAVIYTAHWDHLGRDSKLTGDQIFNGALDNASGVAMVLELAEAFTRLKSAPKRSILFMSTTAEEKGLLGARYYTTRPLWPLERTVANLNIDSINPYGRTRNVEVVGAGNSTLETLLESAAATQKRTVSPESAPENGFFYRADHFEFCRVGVPALYFWSGLDYIGREKDYGLQKQQAYIANTYHKVTDEIQSDWDLSGAIEDARLLFRVGWTVAQDKSRPQWTAESEFKPKRGSAASDKGK